MTTKMNNIKLVSTGRYVPKKCLTNQQLEKMIDTTDEWIYTRTGIKSRRIVDDLNCEDTSHLATQAALNAMSKVNYDKDKIDLIIVATFTPDYSSPSVANLVQAKLGLSHKLIPCFDINAACTGLIYALDVASQMLASGKYNHALVIGAEVVSKCIDYTDRNTCVLFGDGAGALILENTSENKPAMFFCASQGDLDKTLYIDKYLHMDGKKVYVFATNAVERAISKVLNDTNLTIDNFDKIIPHQANVRIIQSVAKSLKIDMSKFFVNLEEYGNTSAASIAIALDEYLEVPENQKTNGRIMLVGFGGGFTFGGAMLTL
jgi:3-oxoacyl-[acyl-carrier-protein] synthase-3